MFAHFRRYQKAIFLGIIIVIIPGFVLVVSQVSDLELWGRLFTDLPGVRAFFPKKALETEFGSMRGRPFKREEANMARNEVRLGYYLRFGRWPSGEEERNLERDTLSRLFLIEKIKEMDIHVSEKAIALVMRDHIGDLPREQFEKEHLAQANLSWDEYYRFARHEAAIRQLYYIGGLSGKFLDPTEAAESFRKDHEESDLTIAAFWASNYLNQVTVTPEEIGKYYTNRRAFYRIPERIQVSYVAFPATNYVAEADKLLSAQTNLDANISRFYFEKGTNQFKDAEGKVMSEADAKQSIKDQQRKQFAMMSAHRAISEFGNELFALDQPNSLAKFENFAAAKGVPVQVTPPFDRSEGLSDTNFPPEFEEYAFKLLINTNEPIYYRPILGENAAYMIAFKQRFAPEFPPLDQVRDKVTADYKLDRAGELARAAGTNFSIFVFTNQTPGKSFAELATQQGIPVIKLTLMPSTTELTNVDQRLRLSDLQRVVFDLTPGQSSRFVTTDDPKAGKGGWIAHLEARRPVSAARLQAELPKYMATLRQYRHQDAFNQWFTKQVTDAQLTPATERTNAPPASKPSGGQPSATKPTPAQ